MIKDIILALHTIDLEDVDFVFPDGGNPVQVIFRFPPPLNNDPPRVTKIGFYDFFMIYDFTIYESVHCYL